MARPKKSELDAAAINKIENAFWTLLEKTSYSEITVSMICLEAEVNRNSFYYHYENIDDLAQKAFKGTVNQDLVKEFLGSITTLSKDTSIASKLQDLPQFYHVLLCAGCDSPFINKLTRELFKEVWFSSLSIDENKLSPKEQLEIEFLFSGLIAVLGSDNIRNNPKTMSVLPTTEIGQCAIKTLKRIAKEQQQI